MTAWGAGPDRPNSERPPRLLTWLVGAALPRDARGSSIMGDLIEEWHARPAGLRRTLWYARECMRIGTRYLFVGRRLPGMRAARAHHRAGAGHRGALGRVVDDLRHAVRGLRNHLTFTVTAVSVLTLGIGAATAVFAAFHAVVLKDLPVTEPERLVRVSLQAESGGQVTLEPEEIDALAAASRTLRGAAGVGVRGAGEAFPLTVDGRPLVLGMGVVTGNFFEVLGVRPVLGRLLQTLDNEEGAAPVAVVTYETWQRDFGGDPGVVGRRLTQTQTGRSYRVVGVAPPGLEVPVGVGYWIPVGTPGRRAFGGASMDVVARLADDASAERARQEVLSLARTLDVRRSTPASPETAAFESLAHAVLGDVEPMLIAITVAVGLLLLIACVNVGNLLLIRTTQRSREVVVRRALGASSGGIARLLLAESALIGAAGGLFGLALSVWLLRLLPHLAPDGLPRSDMIGLGGAPVAVAIAVTATAVLLFGVLPPVVAARGSLASALRTGTRSGTGTRTRRRARRWLVGAQVALAVLLLFGAGLVARSLQRLRGLDLGYDAERVAVLELTLDREGRGPAETFSLLARVLERMREMPGVDAATWIMSRPFLGTAGVLTVQPTLEGQTDVEAATNPPFPVEVGGRELFRTLGIPIVRGRGLLDSDREDAPRMAVVSEGVARRLWPGGDPLGQRIEMMTSRPSWWTVVGVAADTRFRYLRDPTPTIYVHYRQLQVLPAVWTVAVRTDADLVTVLPAMRQVVQELGRIDVWRAGTLRDYLADGPMAEPRMSAFALSGFGLAALLLAAIGLYGVMALAVRERTHEMGVRRALGASTRRLRWGVLGDALMVTGAGTALGLGAALLLSRLLSPLLFEVRLWDPATATGVGATLLCVAAVAAFLPAQRATVVDPMEALRAE